MNLVVIRGLRRVKRLHVERAEEEQRRRQAAFRATVEAAATAERALADWRDDMPRKQTVIYQAVIGQVVGIETLETVKAQVIVLRDHERVLQDRLHEAQNVARTAESALQSATAAARAAQRNLGKFDDLAETLRRVEALLLERREDSELEEAIEGRDGAVDDGDDGFDEDTDGRDGRDEWDQATG